MGRREARPTPLERKCGTLRRRIGQLRHRLRGSQVQFVRTELKVGLTFASLALAARRDTRKMARLERLARRAYDAAGRFTAALELSATEHKELNTKTQALKAALNKLPSRKA